MTASPGPEVTPAMVAYGQGIAEPRLSPDGSEVAYVATINRRAVLVVVPVDGGAAVTITADLVPRGAGGYGGGAFAWTPDGRSLVVAADGDLWLVPRSGGPGRRLTSHGSGAGAPSVSPDGTRVAYTVDLRDVAVVSLSGTSWPVRLPTPAAFVADPAWSADGVSVLWQEWDLPWMPWDESRIVGVPADGSREAVVVHGSEQTQSLQVQPSPSAGTLAFLTDTSGWLRVTLLEPGGPPRPLVDEDREHGGPTWVQGQRSFVWSPDGTRLAFHRNEHGFGRLCVTAVNGPDRGVVREVAKGWHESLTWQGERVAAVRSGAKTPTQLVVYDTSSWERQTLARGPVAGWEAVLGEPEPLTWSADDGAQVHGRLHLPATPVTGEGTRAPLLVWTHGGPSSQAPVAFQARVAYFVAKGWAVLQADHRGSTGHGRAYLTAMRERWGDLDVEDTAAGVRTLLRRDVVDASRVVAIGASAGGFTTYGLLARHPDLFAAGVVLYGVADLLHLDEVSHRFERHYNHTLVGPLPATVDRYRYRSPVNYASAITAPMLVLQGTADLVVPPAQSQAIVDRLRALGRDVEHHEYEGEGHGWSRPETVIDELERTDDFLRRHVLRWRP